MPSLRQAADDLILHRIIEDGVHQDDAAAGAQAPHRESRLPEEEQVVEHARGLRVPLARGSVPGSSARYLAHGGRRLDGLDRVLAQPAEDEAVVRAGGAARGLHVLGHRLRRSLWRWWRWNSGDSGGEREQASVHPDPLVVRIVRAAAA